MHGGSLRVVAARSPASRVSAECQAIQAYEQRTALDRAETWIDFGRRISRKIDIVRDVFDGLRRRHTIWGYGAAGKATMWVNACGMDYLGGMVDASPLRAGKLMPGTHTPIVFPDRFKEAAPDVVFITAWNYASGITAKESWFKGELGRSVAGPAVLLMAAHARGRDRAWRRRYAGTSLPRPPAPAGAGTGAWMARPAPATRPMRSRRRRGSRHWTAFSTVAVSVRDQLHRRAAGGHRRGRSGERVAGRGGQRALSARARVGGRLARHPGVPRVDRRGVLRAGRHAARRKTPRPIPSTSTGAARHSARAAPHVLNIRCSIVGRDPRGRGLTEWYLRTSASAKVAGTSTTSGRP